MKRRLGGFAARKYSWSFEKPRIFAFLLNTHLVLILTIPAWFSCTTRVGSQPNSPAIMSIGVNEFKTSLKVQLAPDGKAAYYLGLDGIIRVWDPLRNKELRNSKIGNAQVSSLAFNRAGTRAVIGSKNGMYSFVDFASKKTRTIQGHTAHGELAAISPCEEFAIIAGGDNAFFNRVICTLKIWDLTTGKLRQSFVGHTSFVADMAISIDGKSLVTGAGTVEDLPVDCTARMWDINTGKESRRFVGHTGTVNCVALTRDSLKLLTGSNDRSVRLWCVVKNAEVWKVSLNDIVWCIAISPDEKVCLVGSGSVVFVLNLETGRHIGRFVEHSATVTSVGCFPDGKTVFSASMDGSFRTWRRPSHGTDKP